MIPREIEEAKRRRAKGIHWFKAHVPMEMDFEGQETTWFCRLCGEDAWSTEEYNRKVDKENVCPGHWPGS